MGFKKKVDILGKSTKFKNLMLKKQKFEFR